MSAGSESWSQPADPRRAVVALGLALAAFVAAWALLHEGFYTRQQIIDTPVYQRYGDAIAGGQVPYRDFGVEYPPAALPVFALPSLLRSEQGDLLAYRQGFEAVMLVCGALALAFMLLTLLRLGAGQRRLFAALGLAAVAPLMLGSVVLSRYDLWPVALTTAALAALVAGRERVGSAVLGVAFAAKVYPGVLLPLAVAYVWRRAGRREAAVCLGLFAAAALACFLPFLALAPHGVWDSVVRQMSRPLQIESLGAGLLLVAHHVAGVGITMRTGYGSQNLVGTAPDVLAALQTALQLGALVAVWAWFARGPADGERLVRAAAAAVCAFIVFGKVLSPQFLIWLIPLVPLLRGRRGLAAGTLLALSLVLTQLWFPSRYFDLALHFDALMSWLVLGRDLALVGLLALLLWPGRAELGPVG